MWRKFQVSLQKAILLITCSIGERQLICLARGLLSRAMVIVLDEATASVDLATEEKIHDVIFHQCKTSTMILIGSAYFT